MPLISVLIPTHRDMHLLKKSLPVFLASPQKFEVVVINNDPSQNVREWLDSHFDDHVKVIDMGWEAGFVRAINTGIRQTTGEFVMLCNADLFLSPTYADEILSFFDQRATAGAASGKILRYEITDDRATDIIDTAGLMMGRNRRALVRGEGERDVGQLEGVEQVFGNDGVGLILRRRALESIKVNGEYLDESFFMYKEDWDLSWRLRLAGWECWYVPTAIGFHARTSRGLGEKSYRSAVLMFHRNERSKSMFVRFHSMKNQWIMLLKNEDWYNFWRDGAYIIGRETGVVLYNLVFSPKTLAAIPAFLRLLPHTLRKRRAIKTHRRLAPREIRRSFGMGRTSSSRNDRPRDEKRSFQASPL
jgi:GT2 family glycosyltransferase